tara:strand:- start:109 stop:684 length:576 start_codon:yes stop_codon:yes gene_type:complete
MAYIGKTPTPAPLTSSDIANGIVSVDKLTSTLDLSSNTVTLPSGVGGKVLQVVQTVKTDTFSTTSTSMTDLTGLSASITPSSSSNKILVNANFSSSTSEDSRVNVFNLLRDSTTIAQPSGSGGFKGTRQGYIYNNGNIITVDFNFLDSPSTTSATTYKIQMYVNGGTGYVGDRLANDMDNISTITLMEISA